MKRVCMLLAVLLGSRLIAPSASCASSAPEIRIMPLGDSITYGSSTPAAPGGYRLPLYVALTNAGYNVDYVGTQTGNPDAGLGAEVNHEGHGGWTIGGLDGSILDWFEAIDDPHVILLHIGTNDSGGGTAFTNAVDRLDALVTKMAKCQPSAHIVVTTLLKRNEPNYTAITNYFNPYVPGKVAAQQALGRRVHFLDMHACMTTNEMNDALHPNAYGYSLMATNTPYCWFTAITNIIGTNAAPNQPAAIRASSYQDRQTVTISFNKKISSASATNLANYAFSGGLTLLNASLSASQRTVTLTTSLQDKGTWYTVTLNNIEDETSPTPLTVPADTQFSFVGQTTRGYTNNVPEAAGYTLVYSVDLPNNPSFSSAEVPYSVTNAAFIGSFTRVAYYLELQKTGEDIQFLWVSMDAITNSADKLGVPTFRSGALFQRRVDNMNVYCNVPGVVTNTGITTGNIEFWPYNYSAGNALSIPGADGGTYDFGDQCSFNYDYGCMQVHNYGASQTLFAINHWNTGGTLEVGIGNQPTGNPDWTFSNNGANYAVKTLQVLVKRDSGDTTPPVALSAVAGIARDLVVVTFDEPVNAGTVDPSHFALDAAVTITNTFLQPDQRTVYLRTSRQPAGVPLTLSYQGIRDTSPNANPVPPGASIAVSSPSLPPEVISNVGTNAGDLAEGYQLIYTLDVPVVANFNSLSDYYRYNQCSMPLRFDRIAYYLELQAPGQQPQYVWTSMDAFTADPAKIGLPVNATGAVFQQYVSNLVVKSNVSGVSNGTDIVAGNIEFWASSYGAGNAKGIPGASSTACDFGDDRGSNTGAGHGCMQVHNYLSAQTVFAINHFGTDGNVIALGIGNKPATTSDPDWTFTYNAGSYARRVLHVMVRPIATPPLPPELAARVPQAEDYQLAYTVDLPVYGNFYTSSDAFYLVNNYTNGLTTAFSRIAYYLELVPAGTSNTQFLWTAMDAFTTDARRIGVPTNNCVFRQYVNDLEVYSNVPGVSNGVGQASGFIEFWPSDYGDDNTYPVPGASNDSFDFGDSGGSSGKGYGSMQVHNYGAAQTLFAVNHFNDPASRICVGIGNSPTGNPDWTFRDNANQYDYRRLHVLVLPGSKWDAVRPWVVNAAASADRRQVSVLFNEALADDAADPSHYALSNGVAVTGARLLANRKTVILDTTPMGAGTTNTLTLSHVRDASVAANEIPLFTRAILAVPSGTLPTVFGSIPEAADYEMIQQLSVANTTYYLYGCNFTFDQTWFARTQAIARIAYCMELQNATRGYHWVYASMDPFTSDIGKVGVPTADRATMWQTYVSNLNIYASENIANTVVTTGVGIASGNIEFWPSNYGQDNTLGIPGALSKLNGTNVFDFGDGSAGVTAGHGSMQVHNYLSGHTVFAMNAFGTNGRTPCLGIGNNTTFTMADGTQDPDWTFYSNAGLYTVKNIYVLAKPGAPLPVMETGSKPDIWNQPVSQSILSGHNAVFTVLAPYATAYQWRKNGQPISGATGCCLTFTPADLGDNGTYDVLVYGSGTAFSVSQSATLTVYPLGTVLRLR